MEKLCTGRRARQAAELLLVVVDELDVVEDDEDEDDEDAEEEDVDFDAGVLLDDAPRLSFR